jgi:hypothetical protein
MLETCMTLITMAAGDMGLCGYTISLLEVRHIFADLDHFGSVFVAEEEGKLNP